MVGSRRWFGVVVVLGLLLTAGATFTPAAAAPAPTDTDAAAPTAAGATGEPVTSVASGSVNVADIATTDPAAPADGPSAPVPVPLGEGPSAPSSEAPPADLVRPDPTGPEPSAPADPEPSAPSVGASFAGPTDSGWLPPDTDGAVGPNHVVTALNGAFAIQTRTGGAVSQVTLNSFWSSVLGGGSSFDPRITYDRFNNRWITVAAADSRSASSGLLLGVSATSDPTGSWILRRYDVDANDDEWGDFPTLGFNKNWITVGFNMFQVNSPGGFTRPQLYAIDKMALYAGGPGSGSVWTGLASTDFGFTLMPATTEDNTTETQYLARVWGQTAGNGYLALHQITGTVGAPSLSTVYAFPEATGASWSSSAAASNSAPQLGGNPVNAGDDRIHGFVLRNGELWVSHHVFLPAGAPTRSVAQWWNLTASTGAVLQRGRIDSGSSATWFTYPSIAVNAAEDVLIGYSRFSTTQYPSANFSFRRATDPAGTMQADTLLKAGEANYVKNDSVGRNRWGDYSSTQVDPVNDTDLWTVQEYARTPSSTWGTWWGRVVPEVPAPANDNFASATVLPARTGTTTGATAGATKESGEPNHAGNGGGGSVWYRYTPANSGSTTIDTAGSDFDTLLAVYTGSTVGGLTLVQQNDDDGGVQSRVTFDAVAGTTYRIAVDGYNNVRGAVTLNWDFPTATGVAGTVSESGTGTPVGAAWVAALRTSDFALVGGAVANASGVYSLTLPAGTYYLYLIDPAGTHTAGFFGSPTQVNVTAGAMATANPTMASNRGTISGTVRDAGTSAAIPGALVLSLGGPNTDAEAGSVANAGGAFSLANVPAGNHYVGYIDPTGAHATRFFANSPDVPQANPVAVSGGGTTTANATLPAQVPPAAGQTLSGTLTETGTGTPLSGVYVVALRAADFQMVRAAVTNAAGAYSMSLASGSYKLGFVDSTGLHDMEWHNNQPNTALASATSVSPPATTNADLRRNRGAFAGTVTDQGSAAGLVGSWVVAIGPSGIVAGALTGAGGAYTLGGLPAGTYRATFLDPTGIRRQEYWNNSTTYDGATPITVTGGGTTSSINAALAP